MKEKLGWLLFLVSVIGSLVASFWLAEKIHINVEVWQKYGYGGIFLGALTANATVLFSIPFVLLPFALKLAEQTDPFFLGIFYAGIIYAAGAAFGELTGYLVGFSTGGVLRKALGKVINNRHFKAARKMSGLERLSTAVQERGEAVYGVVEKKVGFKQKIPIWLAKYGGWTIIGLAFIPSPFDFLGLLLGSMRYPLWKFWLFTFLGRIPKYALAIYLLHVGINLVFH